MVRGDQYTDESDSDWDSLSQAVPAPPMAQSAQLGIPFVFILIKTISLVDSCNVRSYRRRRRP